MTNQESTALFLTLLLILLCIGVAAIVIHG